jgi:flagellar basal-body rod protein FlgC
MFGSLDISTSGLVAQRNRMSIIAANLANQFSVEDAQGNYAPYRRRVPVFAPGDPVSGRGEGVHLSQVLEPENPHADAQGYVEYPNIDASIEMINAIEATRAYEANITAAEATKSMIQASLRLLG